MSDSVLYGLSPFCQVTATCSLCRELLKRGSRYAAFQNLSDPVFSCICFARFKNLRSRKIAFFAITSWEVAPKGHRCAHFLADKDLIPPHSYFHTKAHSAFPFMVKHIINAPFRFSIRLRQCWSSLQKKILSLSLPLWAFGKGLNSCLKNDFQERGCQTVDTTNTFAGSSRADF